MLQPDSCTLSLLQSHCTVVLDRGRRHSTRLQVCWLGLDESSFWPRGVRLESAKKRAKMENKRIENGESAFPLLLLPSSILHPRFCLVSEIVSQGEEIKLAGLEFGEIQSQIHCNWDQGLGFCQRHKEPRSKGRRYSIKLGGSECGSGFWRAPGRRCPRSPVGPRKAQLNSNALWPERMRPSA